MDVLYAGSSMRMLHGNGLLESSTGILYGDPLWRFAEGSSWESSMGILGAPLRGFSTGILFGDPLWGPSMRIRYGVLYLRYRDP